MSDAIYASQQRPKPSTSIEGCLHRFRTFEDLSLCSGLVMRLAAVTPPRPPVSARLPPADVCSKSALHTVKESRPGTEAVHRLTNQAPRAQGRTTMRTFMPSLSRRLVAGAFFAGALTFAATAAQAAVYKVHHGNPAGTYKIDPHHSLISFWVGHSSVSEVPGRFDKISGTFTFDAKNPDASKVSIRVPIDSLDTNFKQRNKNLLGPDFFDAKQFPTMTFTSTKFDWTHKNEALMTGNLTLHGITHPVTFEVRRIGAGPAFGGYRSGYVATAVIRRSHFGMSYLLQDVSDKVHIRVNLEGVRQKQ